MTEIRDGFFYHPDGNSPTAELERLLAGEHNPAFDDLFSTTISEVNSEIAAAEQTRRKLLEQMINLRRKLRALHSHKEQVAQATERFGATGEIDPILIPACERLIAKEQAAFRKTDAEVKVNEVKAANASLTETLPDGWDIAGTRADDEFVYVTIRRRRDVVAAERPSPEKIVERVQKAFETYRLDFLKRIRPLRMAAVTASPRASP